MAIYNTSWMNNVTSPLDIATGLNSIIGEQYYFMVGNLGLILLFLILLQVFYKPNSNDYIIYSLAMVTIVSILFYITGMVGIISIVLPAIFLFLWIIIDKVT